MMVQARDSAPFFLAEIFLVVGGCQFVARAPLHEDPSLFVLSQKQSHDRYHSCPK